MKKILALIMVLVLIVPLFPVHAETVQNPEPVSDFEFVQVKEELVINEENESLITLQKGLMLFVKNTSDYNKIKIGEKEYTLPKDKVVMIDDKSTEESLFVTSNISSINKTERFEKGTVLFEDETLLKKAAIVEKDLAITILEETQTYLKISLGERHLYIKKEESKETSINQKENLIENDKKEKSLSKPNLKVPLKNTPVYKSNSLYFSSAVDQLPIFENRSGKLIKVGYLVKNQTFKKVRDTGNWIEIKHGDKKAYVWKLSTVPSSIENIKNLNEGLTNQNIYFKPHSELPVYDNSSNILTKIAVLNANNKYPIIDQVGDWLKIDISGRVGFVHKTGYSLQFNNDMKYFKAASPNVPIIDTSSGQSKTVGFLKKDELYERTRSVGNWHEIKFGNKTAFIWKDATVPSTIKPRNLNNSNEKSKYMLKGLEDLPVFDNSTGKLVPFATLNKGIQYPVIEQKGNWLKVDLANRIGFIYSPATDLLFNKNTHYFEIKQEKLEVFQNSNGKLISVGNLLENKVYKRIRDVGNWHEIKLGDKNAYVWKSSTKPNITQTPPNPVKSNVDRDYKISVNQNLPIYDNSTGKMVPFAELKAGVNYSIISEQGNWMKVDFAGRLGYLYKTGYTIQFTSNINKFEIVQDFVKIVQNQNGKLVSIGSLERGMQFVKISSEGNWHVVKLGDKIGYVWKNSTKAIINGNFKQAHSKQSGYVKFIENGTVYDNSTGSLRPLGKINKGTEYPFVEKKGNWYKIIFMGREAHVYHSAVTPLTTDVVNPNQVYTYETMEKDIAKLETMYSGLVRKEIIGYSVDGRKLYAIKLGKGNVEIFFNGSHHAREHMTTNVLMEMVDTYANSYVKGTKIDGFNTKDLLNKTSIWFVPMVNPDGVTLVQKGHTSAKNPKYVLMLNNNSRNFRSWKANIRGVDLNRQYPADWANIVNDTGKPSSKNYKGPKPLSEPESLAIYNFTNKHNFKTAVAYHSSGEILYWNFRQDSARYKRDENIAKMIRNKTGYSLVYPGSNPSGGGYTDWFIYKHRKPSFTPEISPHVYEQPVPLKNYPTIWYQNYSIGLMLANEAFANRNNR
ncbi:M14 family metallocarboxypeptidase [Metabacillus idriensis]|uniref:M14 family metallocarboxypeptidase n=1 Tax=Metabacillus idriensis TaxID=324768 RepID=UPI00174BE000|nr:M14 family metallocarboxypeptidase [Metabacillus idriensis]